MGIRKNWRIKEKILIELLKFTVNGSITINIKIEEINFFLIFLNLDNNNVEYSLNIE